MLEPDLGAAWIGAAGGAFPLCAALSMRRSMPAAIAFCASRMAP